MQLVVDVLYVVKCVMVVDYQYKFKLIFSTKHRHYTTDEVTRPFAMFGVKGDSI